MPDTRRGGGSRSCHVAIASQGARGTRGGGVTRRHSRQLGDDTLAVWPRASGCQMGATGGGKGGMGGAATPPLLREVLEEEIGESSREGATDC